VSRVSTTAPIPSGSSVLSELTSHCKLGKRRRQEHVGALLHLLLTRVRYDGQTGRVTLEFKLATGMDGAAPFTFTLTRSEKPGQHAAACFPRLTRLLALAVRVAPILSSPARQNPEWLRSVPVLRTSLAQRRRRQKGRRAGVAGLPSAWLRPAPMGNASSRSALTSTLPDSTPRA
jgi:hypothetical protein